MPSPSVSVVTRPWGIAPDGSIVESFQISNDVLSFEVISFGARLTSLVAPDREGDRADVVLGYAALEPYIEDTYFLGCTVGRYANRIARGQFVLNGERYTLDRNNDGNTLHGGSDGLWHHNWTGRALQDGLELTLSSPAGDQGFPGNLSVTARYRLRDNQITLEYEATSDQDTVINLTNHAYFNLAGEGTPDVLGHRVQILADAFTPIAEDAIPLPEGNQPVAGTPFDFTAPHTIGERIHEPHPQLLNGHGYDHNFVLREAEQDRRVAAVVTEPRSGRRLQVSTTQPGVQFYTGNYLAGTTVGRSGRPYGFRGAFCLETQHFPDSPNRPEFPSTVLKAHETFRSSTVWALDVVPE